MHDGGFLFDVCFQGVAEMEDQARSTVIKRLFEDGLPQNGKAARPMADQMGGNGARGSGTVLLEPQQATRVSSGRPAAAQLTSSAPVMVTTGTV